MEDLKFGDIVEVESCVLKICQSKLKELHDKYGKCLSKKQLSEFNSQIYDDNYDSSALIVTKNDLEILHKSTYITMLVSENTGHASGSYSSSLYSEYTGFSSGKTTCQTYNEESVLVLNEVGTDFEDYNVRTPLIIKRIIGFEEKQQYLKSNFYKDLRCN